MPKRLPGQRCGGMLASDTPFSPQGSAAAILARAAAAPPRQGAARGRPRRRRRGGRSPAMADKMAAAAASPQPQPGPGSSSVAMAEDEEEDGGGGSGGPRGGGVDGEVEAEEFGCPAHCADLAWRQNEQRRHGLYCDITLAFGGGRPGFCREYRAHRSVLAAATEYFTPLLSGGFAESRSGRVELQKWSSEGGPDPDTVEAVIGFMYTGTIRVSPGNVHEVLEMADR